MDKVRIETSQNIDIDYEVSNIGDRFLAFLIDTLVMFGLIMVLGFISSFLARNGIPYSFISIMYFLIIIMILFYHLICELTMDGQSVGKRWRKIKVMKTDGTQASFGNYFIRFLLRPIDSIFGIGLIFILFSDKGQRLGDLAAGTTLVKLKKRISLSDALSTPLEQDYKPVFAQAFNLRDKDINIIKEILHSRRNEPHHRSFTILSDKIKELLKVQTQLPPQEFLQTIVKDYTHYHTRDL